ncbi:NAD-dependent epimerase/dehydratase family protein [Microbacterium sp. NPDC055903]
MKIAVTGASGFIGGAVATALADDGHDVTGFGRRVDGWTHPRAVYRRWDLTARPREPEPFDAVVHSAALADDWAPYDEALRVNRDGTRHVRAAFRDARLVHLSTSSVYDAFSPSVMLGEGAPMPQRFLSSYSASKASAERELEDADAVILRPHAVYGPGDTTLLPRVVQSVRRGRLVLPAGGEVRHSLTRIDNLVQAVRLSLTGPAGVYNIADAEPVLLADVLSDFLRRRGVDARIVGIPTPLASALAGASEASARLRRTRPRLTRYAVSQLGVERTFDLTAARHSLGYAPLATTLAGAETW